MLIGFTFKNFLSFYDETIFSMVANNNTSFQNTNVHKTSSGNFIKNAIIFGANGSGKTNLILAFHQMKKIVTADLNEQSDLLSRFYFFMFNMNAYYLPISFEVRFIAENKIVYEYVFEFLKGVITKEYLRKKKDKQFVDLFTRDGSDYETIKLCQEMNEVEHLKKNTRKDNLFLYWANIGNNEIAMSVYQWFKNIEVFLSNDSSNMLSITMNYILNYEEGKKNVLKLLQKADTGIHDFHYELYDVDPKNDLTYTATRNKYTDTSKTVELFTKRNLFDSKWSKINDVASPISTESAGTKKLFEISGPIILALQNGGVLLIDEIDTRLHPLLVRFLIMLFNSKSNNPHNAQLICNTHNVQLLELDIRKDQIYFTEKDDTGRSKLYSLSDFKDINKESDILRQYLLGMYGATPKFKDF